MEDLETSAALAFHGVEYVVTVGVERQELFLQVEVEDVSSAAGAATSGSSGNGSGSGVGYSVGDCWTARFPAACAWLESLFWIRDGMSDALGGRLDCQILRS